MSFRNEPVLELRRAPARVSVGGMIPRMPRDGWLAAAVTALALGAVACGGGDGGDRRADATPSATAEPETSAEPESTPDAGAGTRSRRWRVSATVDILASTTTPKTVGARLGTLEFDDRATV